MRSNTATVAGQNIHLFDTTDIKQIEILRGPASVQYGTDAIGGVIQLISKLLHKIKSLRRSKLVKRILINLF